MKKKILEWLFGVDNVKSYMELLYENKDHTNECLRLVDDHLLTLDRYKDDLQTIRKLIVICEKHGINVDEEFKLIQN